MDGKTEKRLTDLETAISRLKSFESGPSLGSLYGQYLALPGLKGFWPTNVHDSSDWALKDLSGNGRTLSWNFAPGLFIAPAGFTYAQLGGSNGASRASDTAMANYAALTVMYWLYPMNSTTSFAIAKDLTYNIYAEAGVQTLVRLNGAHDTRITWDGLNTWNFIAIRWTAGSEVKMWNNTRTVVNTTSVPASLNVNASPFQIGGINGQSFYITLVALTNQVVPDKHIDRLFNMSRIFFGV